MTEVSDMDLMREYADQQSEAAFAELVHRHVNLVYSVAVRCVGNSADAQDVAQAVFLILAKKAGQLRQRPVLTGWLYETTRHTCARLLRTRGRQQARDQEAYMQSTLNDPDPDGAWRQLAPHLEEAMSRLGERDRTLLALRYFENKTAAEIAACLQLNEPAAHKRLARALEKLRRIFAKRGVTLSGAVIAGAMAANSVQAAPAGLAATISAGAAQGTFVSATLTTLVKGTMKTMTWMKLKFAAGVALAALLAGGAALVAVSQTSGGGELTARAILEKSHAAYAALSSYSDTGTVVAEIGGQTLTTTFKTRLQRPNQYHIDWTQNPGPMGSQGVVWSAGNGDNLQITAPAFLMAAAGQKKNDQPQKMPNLKTALVRATPLSAFAASTIPGAFFKQTLGDFTGPAASGRHPLSKEPDALAGGVDCYVVASGMIDLSTVPDIGKPGSVATTFWIGKKDFLIHQCRTKYVERADPAATVDEAIKKSLALQNIPATPEAMAALRPQMEQIMKQVQTSLGAGVVYTQTHENMTVNQEYSVADFAR